MQSPQVSIIIATYNRAGLIADTLVSIRDQTLGSWECLIIDDGSTDDTETAVLPFVQSDARFSYEKRPTHVKKGANACRNYGFSKSSGAFVKFFDSDDLMLPTHLEIVVGVALSRKLDYVVSDCQNFDENGLRERPYETDKNNITISAEDFALFRNGWITNDLLVTRHIAGQLEFNEEIRDLASEYQYCIRLLLLTTSGLLIPDILTHRRVHGESIFVQMTEEVLKWKSLVAENKLFTLEYVEDLAPESLKKWFLSGFMQYSFDIACARKKPKHQFKAVPYISRYFSAWKSTLYLAAITTGYLSGKGYNILKKARI